MANLGFKGLEEYSAKLNRLSALSRDNIIGAAVYDGAKIMADAIKAELNALPTDEGHDRKKAGPSQADKDAVIQGMGIAPMQDDDGYLNVKVGFDGYDARPTPQYPRGHPIAMLARSIRSGTSWMEGHDFVKTAKAKSRPAAIAAMKQRVEREIEKIMK